MFVIPCSDGEKPASCYSSLHPVNQRRLAHQSPLQGCALPCTEPFSPARARIPLHTGPPLCRDVPLSPCCPHTWRSPHLLEFQHLVLFQALTPAQTHSSPCLGSITPCRIPPSRALESASHLPWPVTLCFVPPALHPHPSIHSSRLHSLPLLSGSRTELLKGKVEGVAFTFITYS